MQTILAEGGWGEILPLLILAAIALIANLIKKVSQQKEKRQQEENSARSRHQQSPKSEPPATRSPWAQPVKRPPAPHQTSPPQIQRQAATGRAKLPDQVGTADLGEGQARRIELQNQQRTRRLASRQVPEADTEAIGAKLGRLNQQTSPNAIVVATGLAAGLDLGDADALKRAIIHQEILSPPLAMRKEQGTWEQ